MTHLTRTKDQHHRRVLHARDPHCHWCSVLTVDPSKVWPNEPDNMATLDQIKSRLQCETKEEYRSVNNKVLACRKCNADRDREFHLNEQPWAKYPRPARCRPAKVFVAPELGEALDAPSKIV